MAVDLLTEASSSRGISPRISFSHDLNNCDVVPIEPHIPLKGSSLLDYDFDFCVSKRSCDQNSTLADELFANGVILPIQIKRKDIPMISKTLSTTSSSSCLFPPLPPSSTIVEAENCTETEEKQGKDNSKSFWKFKRSKSLNCGRIYRRGLCSLPLLSRSKSTGSSASAKRSLISKDETSHHQQQQQQQPQQKPPLKNLSSTHHQKPPLKKNYGSSSSFNSGFAHVNPVLNVPTGKYLGFGYIFSNTNKDKAKKKLY